MNCFIRELEEGVLLVVAKTEASPLYEHGVPNQFILGFEKGEPLFPDTFYGIRVMGGNYDREPTLLTGAETKSNVAPSQLTLGFVEAGFADGEDASSFDPFSVTRSGLDVMWSARFGCPVPDEVYGMLSYVREFNSLLKSDAYKSYSQRLYETYAKNMDIAGHALFFYADDVIGKLETALTNVAALKDKDEPYCNRLLEVIQKKNKLAVNQYYVPDSVFEQLYAELEGEGRSLDKWSKFIYELYFYCLRPQVTFKSQPKLDEKGNAAWKLKDNAS